MSTNTQDLSNLSVLACFAHPDDEGFGSGGTLAMLAARGAHVTLVCATNGDVGEISDPALATPETLAQVRQEELRKAMAVTGVQDLRFLNYRDSGMAGTEDNNHPNSLHQAEPGRVVGQLVSIIREVHPEVVITHDPTGGYGHPDHQAVCQRATQAFSLAGDANTYPEQLTQGRQAWTPERFTTFASPAATSGACGSKCWTWASLRPSPVWILTPWGRLMRR
jgi:LmbE family N-acetylglucosaminyl deacetylase